jgi:hypothetical protein
MGKKIMEDLEHTKIILIARIQVITNTEEIKITTRKSIKWENNSIK